MSYTFSRTNPVQLAYEEPEHKVKRSGGGHGQTGCDGCEKYEKCIRRVEANMWVCCEIPTVEELAFWEVNDGTQA